MLFEFTSGISGNLRQTAAAETALEDVLGTLRIGILRLRKNFAAHNFFQLLRMTELFQFPTRPAFPTSPLPRTRGCGVLPAACARKRTSASPVPRTLRNNLFL